MSPLPPLEWTGFSWECDVVLPSWAGYQARRGPYAALSVATGSDGSARLYFSTANADSSIAPTEPQAAAFQYLVDHDEAVTEAVVRAIFAEYPRLRDRYGFAAADPEGLMSEAASIDDLKHRIGLSGVHVSVAARSGMAYLGFELGCTWDEEHGLGVLAHGQRVVDFGGADTAFLEWNAARDARAIEP